MKKFLVTTILLAFVFAFPVPTMAEVNVGVSISLPPMIVFASPPEMVVIPETYVYVVPDAPEEIFFYNGWWWRPWEGRWYRSRNYDSGWAHYRRVPTFYTRVPRGWRNDYRDHRWGGRPWNHQRIPHQEVRQNWSGWQKSNYWENKQTWGVQGLKPRTQAKQQPRAVQQKSQERSQPREAAKPQQSRPQSGEVKQQQAPPQHREVQPQHSQPQRREAAPKQSKPAQGKPEKAKGKSDRGQGKPDRGEEDKQDRR